MNSQDHVWMEAMRERQTQEYLDTGYLGAHRTPQRTLNWKMLLGIILCFSFWGTVAFLIGYYCG